MQTAFEKAIELMITADPELLNILGVTAKMSLSSSLIALLLGVPLGLLLGAASFRGRGLLVVLNRTLMGMPPYADLYFICSFPESALSEARSFFSRSRS